MSVHPTFQSGRPLTPEEREWLHKEFLIPIPINWSRVTFFAVMLLLAGALITSYLWRWPWTCSFGLS